MFHFFFVCVCVLCIVFRQLCLTLLAGKVLLWVSALCQTVLLYLVTFLRDKSQEASVM